jgi:hypothetical protein
LIIQRQPQVSCPEHQGLWKCSTSRSVNRGCSRRNPCLFQIYRTRFSLVILFFIGNESSAVYFDRLPGLIESFCSVPWNKNGQPSSPEQARVIPDGGDLQWRCSARVCLILSHAESEISP